MKISNTILTLMITGFLSACATPNVLMNHGFQGEKKTMKVSLQKVGGDSKLYNTFLRACDLDQNLNETACKDTLILENVVAESLN